MLFSMLVTIFPVSRLVAITTEKEIIKDLSPGEMKQIQGAGSKKTTYRGYVYNHYGDHNYKKGSHWVSSTCRTEFIYRSVSACRTVSFDDNGYYYMKDGNGGSCKTNTISACYQERTIYEGPQPPPGVPGIICSERYYWNYWGYRSVSNSGGTKTVNITANRCQGGGTY